MQSAIMRCVLLTILACGCSCSPDQPVPAPGRALYAPQMTLPKVPQVPKVPPVQQMPGLPVVGEPQERQAAAPMAAVAPLNGASMTSPSMMAPGGLLPAVWVPTDQNPAQPALYDATPMQPIGKKQANSLASFFGGLAAGFAAVGAVVYATMMKKSVDTQAVEIDSLELGTLPPMSFGDRQVAAARMQHPVTMQFKFGQGPASPSKPVVKKNAKPLSPGSNYPTTKNIQVQRSGFGSFLQKFQKAEGKSKYGMPIFDKNGNVNPAYLAAERKDMAAQKKTNIVKAESKRKGLIAAGQFELADYVRKKIGNVGSGKDYYQSGR